MGGENYCQLKQLILISFCKLTDSLKYISNIPYYMFPIQHTLKDYNEEIGLRNGGDNSLRIHEIKPELR